MSRKEDYEDDDYKDLEHRRLSVMKRLGIAILVILGIIVIFMFLRGCGKTEDFDSNKTLLEAGKEYYEYNDHLLPNSIGECDKVTLTTLSQNGLIDKSKYSSCATDSTYVKVCKLESGKYQFVAILDCENEKTETSYGDWKEAKEGDIITDSSDVKFMFQAQYLDMANSNLGAVEDLWEDDITYTKYKTESVTKYYRYKDLQYIWNITAKRYYPQDASGAGDIKEYYISSPSSDYKNKDSENTSVSKYFSTTESKVYWVDSNGNRKYASKAPDSVYVYPDNAIYQTRYRTRTWTETSKPVTASPTQIWYCSAAGSSYQVTSLVACENNTLNPSFTTTVRMIYSCDGGLTDVGQSGTCYRCTDGSGLRTDRTSCGSYSSWSSYTTTSCDTASDLCSSATITIYQWYKLVNGERKYYPSNASAASGEKTYYASAPASGLIKDTTTTTTGWKWYKKIDTVTSSYYSTSPQTGATKTDTSKWMDFTKWSTSVPKSLGNDGTRVIESKNKIKLRQILTDSESWLTFNEEYMNLDELLTALQAKGYKVYSLDDITASGELKYKVKLYIRNLETK